MNVVTLIESSRAGLGKAIAVFDDVADAFEIRLDALSEPADPAALRRLTSKPLIATCRRFDEKGTWRGQETDRLSLLERCHRAGFEYVDVEDDRRIDVPESRLIRSVHAWQATDDAARNARHLEGLSGGGALAKFASRVRTFGDTMMLLRLAHSLRQRGIHFAVMGLGDFPRPLMRIYGSRLLYGGGRTPAPDQPGIRRVLSTLAHWGDPGAHRDIYLVIGDPIDHSLSPRLHNAAFTATSMDAGFGALALRTRRDLSRLLRDAPAAGIKGLSVTAPLKRDAAALIARKTTQAEAAGSVNAVRFDEKGPEGHNTDGQGAAAVVESRFPDARSVLVVGAGGAAQGIVPQLSRLKVTIAARGRNGSGPRVGFRDSRTLDMEAAAGSLDEFDLLVNATSVQDPLPLGTFNGALFDLHYAAEPTSWARHATTHGNAWAGGLELLLAQGAHAFEYWTGQKAPVDEMRGALGVAR